MTMLPQSLPAGRAGQEEGLTATARALQRTAMDLVLVGRHKASRARSIMRVVSGRHRSAKSRRRTAACCRLKMMTHIVNGYASAGGSMPRQPTSQLALARQTAQAGSSNGSSRSDTAPTRTQGPHAAANVITRAPPQPADSHPRHRYRQPHPPIRLPWQLQRPRQPGGVEGRRPHPRLLAPRRLPARPRTRPRWRS